MGSAPTGVSHGWDDMALKLATLVVVCKATYWTAIGPWPSLADWLGALVGTEVEWGECWWTTCFMPCSLKAYRA